MYPVFTSADDRDGPGGGGGSECSGKTTLTISCEKKGWVFDTALQSQEPITAYFSSKELLPLGFGGQFHGQWRIVTIIRLYEDKVETYSKYYQW